MHKKDFVTPDGQYEFTRILFGMVSGAALVTGFRILEGMPGVRNYIDDIHVVIHSNSWNDHLRN